MANSIALAQKYLPILDEVYKKSSVTSVLDAAPETLDFTGANEVKVYKTKVNGLGNYNRNNGFVSGDVTGEWETKKLTQDRGRSFTVDSMDNEESLNMAFGKLSGEFLRTKVTPEIDAYRFAKYASTAGALSDTSEISTSTAAIEAIDDATASMDEAEVPEEGRILFITPTYYKLLKQNNAIATRFATMGDRSLSRDFEVLDSMRVIKVPQTRFYTGITLYDGKTGGQTDGGYIKASGASNINFMIIHPTAVLQVVKHKVPRIFAPGVNQNMDAWKFDYRIYHDAFTYDNKEKCIYVHKAPAE